MKNKLDNQLRVLAWETTRACPLACPHCRASAVINRDPEELTTNEASEMLDSASRLGKSIIIFSGGEPLLRDDIEELAQVAVRAGHTPVLSCNDGRLLSEARLNSLKKAGLKHFSFSMHSHLKEKHDSFVGVNGAFDNALSAFERIKSKDLSFQINTTILPSNHKQIDLIKDWVINIKAAAWHLFFIVPMGRAAVNLEEVELTTTDNEKVLEYIAQKSDSWPMRVKVTCAPQYARIRAQMNKDTGAKGRSCMAGTGFLFVSYKGDVKPCGYFSMSLGNIRHKSLHDIYLQSSELKDMRQADLLEGVCGKCLYNESCGGCRARAYAVNDNYMSSDPACSFVK